ncbi:MAG: peptidoglycan glycosyltransferase, partial [Spirochaetaceae bacterium]
MSNTNQDKIYQTTTRRLYVILALVVFSSVILIANFFQLMVIEAKPDAYKDPQSPQTERGPILDRNGKILAIQQRLHTVTAWTPSVSHKEETASLLAEILNTEKEILLKKFQSEEGFLFIQRAIEPSQSEEIAKLQEEGKLEGIYLQEGLGRRYPENELASHVIGYVGIDNKGLDGIEYRYDDVLTSSPGEHQGNNFGSQVILTIDSNIQHFTDTLSQELLAEHEASGIIMLVMDSYTGEILAYTSAPAFNPNKFQEYTQEERRNIPVSYLYEPGSVFKIFSISSFLELGAISQSQLFDASVAYERFQDGRSLFRISDLGSYGMINAADIIRYSSNVGAAHA